MKILNIANDQRAAELTAAVARLTDAVAATAAARQKLEQQFAEATLALDRANQRHASELSDAAAALSRAQEQAAAERQTTADEAVQRQMEFDAELMREVTKRQKLAKALTDAETALQTAEQRGAAERQAGAEHAVQLEERFQTELRQEVDRRLTVENEFAETRAALEAAVLGLLDQVAVMRLNETSLEEQTAHERATWERTQVEARERIQYLETDVDLARRSLAASEEQIQQVERASHDLATKCASLEALVAERDSQLREQTARTQASDEAAAKTLAAIEHRLEVALAAGNRDTLAIAQLQEQLDALGEELGATRSERDVQKGTADLVPQLHQQIDDIRAEHRRRFDHIPVSMFRCSRNGEVTEISHALATLLGYDSPEDLQQKMDFAATVFDSVDELQWIVERCLASRSTESIETTWRRKDGTRLIVRVLGVATASDSIDLVAQDVTTLREIEEKLRNSQRMEAVARYASEVAVNCDNLLRHVKQEGEQWLGRIESDAARYQAELLLDEVTRAAGFLRQLAAYGNEQKKIPELVEVNKVLRDMEPVLKRVAGDNIELVMPKPSAPLNLDVDAERVERILVNVAAYGRERMPLGGRLMIEVASVVVDRKFVADYPNVRPGAHVLLTVNEVRRPVRRDFLTAHTQASAANAAASRVDNPGVDLGALQVLVSECGGHLWMMAEPPGDMVLKIHLPRRVLDHLDPRAQMKRSGGTRWINRLSGPQN